MARGGRTGAPLRGGTGQLSSLGRWLREDAICVLHLPARVVTPIDHSAAHHLRVLRESPACICAKILPSRCCEQGAMEVLPRLQSTKSSKLSQPCNQARRNQSNPLHKRPHARHRKSYKHTLRSLSLIH